MGKLVSVKLNRWDGGIVNSARSKSPHVCKYIGNADVVSDPYQLAPYISSESGDAGASTSQKQNFCMAYWTPATAQWKIFALGVKSGAATAQILMKNLDDLSDASWDTPAANESTTGTTSFDLFVYYPYSATAANNKIYGARAGTHIWAFTPDGTTAWADSHQALTYTNIAQGIVHSANNILYIPYDNKIAQNNAGTWNTTAFTIPQSYVITSICEYGAKLAIAAAPLSGVGNSRIFVWDMDATNTLADENIDWGRGSIQILEETDGYLVGISTQSSSAAGTRFNEIVSFKYFTGSGAKTITRLVSTSAAITLKKNKQKLENRIYFPMSINIHGLLREGIWSFGFNPQGQFTVLHERTPNNDTALTSAGLIYGFLYVGDFLLQSYQTSSAFALSKTLGTNTYSMTTIYESVVNPNMPEEDLYKEKTLKSVAVRYIAQPSAGQVVAKQRTDSTTVWSSVTAMFTDTTDSSIIQEMVSNGSTQFTKGREFEFRLEETGGTRILELIYTYEVNESNA